jgi:MFS family permease
MLAYASRLVGPLVTPYRPFLAHPGVKSALVITFLARMPVGMMMLSMVMFLRESLGNFKLAGSILGVYFLAMAVSSPVKGRLIDRLGPMRPLKLCALLDPLSFAAFIAATALGAPVPVIVASVVAMGLFSTPVATLARALWRHRFQSDNDRRMAFALDSVLMELNFTMGPALIGVMLAFTSTLVAVLTAFVTSVIGVLVFLRNPALEYWKQEPATERHPLGPLTEPRLIVLFVVLFGFAMACGLLEVGYPAYATAMALPAFAGLMLALNSFGSAVGGAVFGALHFKLALERQFALLLAAFGCLMFLHLAADSVAVFAVAAFVAGCAISPGFATQALITSRLAPAQYATEAFTWSGTFIVSGLGAGMALGGALSETVHVKAPFAAGGVVMLLCALVALAIRVPMAETTS